MTIVCSFVHLRAVSSELRPCVLSCPLASGPQEADGGTRGGIACSSDKMLKNANFDPEISVSIFWRCTCSQIRTISDLPALGVSEILPLAALIICGNCWCINTTVGGGALY
eukprot:COSAG02_NODE_431_length_22447_cov_7.487202_9_plen_111_part_00